MSVYRCGLCCYLSVIIERTAVRPNCQKKVRKFKPRITIDYENDKDLRQTCDQCIVRKGIL